MHLIVGKYGTKLKLCQYQWRVILPNLILTKVTHYNNIMVPGFCMEQALGRFVLVA